MNEIYIIDDDEAVRNALAFMLSTEGYRVSTFADGAEFLSIARERPPACVILDLYLPGRSGLDILKELKAADYPAPIFMISGRADIATAVDAIKSGATDFIEKPLDAEAVLTRVRNALARQSRWPTKPRRTAPVEGDFPGCERLTPREREVVALVATGASNKAVGRALGISPRTVEVHRARIMSKLGAKNAADLVRIVLSESAAIESSRSGA